MNLLKDLFLDSQLRRRVIDGRLRAELPFETPREVLDLPASAANVVPLSDLARVMPSRSGRRAAGTLTSLQALNLAIPAESAFLPVVRGERLRRAIAEAGATRSVVSAREWTVFVPFPEVDVGVLLPEDASPEGYFGAFGRIQGRDTAIRIDAEGRFLPATAGFASQHCSEPSWGECDPGCGACVLTLVADPLGFVCLCPH